MWSLKSSAAGLTIDEHAHEIASILQPAIPKLSKIGKRQLARLWCEIHAGLHPVQSHIDRKFVETIHEIGAEIVCDLYFHTSGGFVDGACRACRLPEKVAWSERSRYLRGSSAIGEWRAQVVIRNAPREARKYYVPPSGELEDAHVRIDPNLTAIFMPEDKALVLASDVWACSYETGFTAESRLENFLDVVKRNFKIHPRFHGCLERIIHFLSRARRLSVKRGRHLLKAANKSDRALEDVYRSSIPLRSVTSHRFDG
jgi:hypothetical protein